MVRSTEKVCRNCGRFVKEDKCPVCGGTDFSRSWKGVIFVNDPERSKVAQILDIKAPGKYCIWVK